MLHSGRCRLRPAQKRGSARLGQGVNSPLDGDEPTIDVAAQDFRSVWYVRLTVPGTSRALAPTPPRRHPENTRIVRREEQIAQALTGGGFL